MPLYQLSPPPASQYTGTIPHLRIQYGSTCTVHTCWSFEPQPLSLLSILGDLHREPPQAINQHKKNKPVVADIDGSIPDRFILGQVTAENQLPQPHHLVGQAYSHTQHVPDGDVQV